MKNFEPGLLSKKIVMISDYVNPKEYSKKDLRDESRFIQTVMREIDLYKVYFKYIEIKNIADLKKALEPFDINNTIIFNWCEFLNQKEGTAHLVTQFLEERGYIFTGADTACLKLTSSKEQTKKRLLEANILTPNYTIITTDTDFTNTSLKFPIMLKLEDRHSSVGITNDNVVNNIEQLTGVSQRLIQEYHANVLAEEYIDGPEYTATVWGNGNRAVCTSVLEVAFQDTKISMIDTEETKFGLGSKTQEIKEDQKTIDKITQIVVDSYCTLNMYDYGRFDLRERCGEFFVIDANPNPWIGLDAVLFKGSKALGYNYGETILQICEFALLRSTK